MDDENHLAARLRAASVGREQAPFAALADGRIVGCGGLFAAAGRAAAALTEAGVRPGDRVAVQAEKSIEVVQLYLGTVLAGGVFLPLNPACTPAETEYFLRDAEPAVFVCDPDRVEALSAIAGAAGVAGTFTLDGDGRGSWAEETARHSEDFRAVAREADDLAAILYTSGTTGRSKGAMLSHGNLVSNGATLADCWRFGPEDALIHALPIFHTHGLFVAINVALIAGSSLIFMPRFDADAVLAAMPRATAMMGVPTFYTRLLNHPGLTAEAVANMRLFVSGSAPLPAEIHERWRKRTGHAILERYGMTETGMNASNPYDGDRRAGTVGPPLPGVEVKVTDPATGAPLPDGRIGSIEVRGPNVFKGYWRMPEKTEEDLRENGFLITGDLGFFDDRGYLAIAGRSKDVVISGGYNVYPKEIEALIDEIPGVLESAVIGLPHPDLGEGVAAVIVREVGAEDPTAEAVSEALRDRIARYKQPRQIHFTDELPRNAMGKVRKTALKDRYGDAFAAK